MDLKDINNELIKIKNRIAEVHGMLGITGENITDIRIYYKRYKCQNKACKCRNGGTGHGPYPRLQYNNDGEPKYKYISKNADKAFKAAYGENSIIAEALAEISELNKKKRKIEAFFRSYEKLVKELSNEEK